MSRQHWVTRSKARVRAWSFLFCVFSLSSFGGSAEPKAAWNTKEALSLPESAYFDTRSGFIYVSNLVGSPVEKDGNGYISRYTIQGRVIDAKWMTGFDAPKGLRSQRGKLWLSDIDRLVEIDIKAKKVLRTIPIPDSKFLNDVAIGSKGEVYVSDTIASKIFVVRGDKVEVFAEGPELESPNGLLVVGDQLVVAAWGLTTDFSTTTKGRVYSLDLATKVKKAITAEPLGNLDGLDRDGAGNFWVSDNPGGTVYRVTPDGQVEAKFTKLGGPADLGWVPKQNLLVIPRMMENTLTAFSVRLSP